MDRRPEEEMKEKKEDDRNKKERPRKNRGREGFAQHPILSQIVALQEASDEETFHAHDPGMEGMGKTGMALTFVLDCFAL